jgi:hypothetical protein
MTDTNLLNDQPGSAKPAEGIPAKFWDSEKGEVRVDALLKSYLELEKRMANSLPEPTDEETRARFLRAAGVPATPDEYSVTVKDALFEPDVELNRRLHEKGFSSDQVQEVYDLAVDHMVPLILDLTAEFQAEREIERLVTFFGGEDQWREASRQMLAFGKKNLPATALQGMSASYEGIMALHKMMQSEEPQTITARTKGVSSNAEKDLQSMMNDPRYWRDKDPSYIAKVTEGFKNLYAE